MLLPINANAVTNAITNAVANAVTVNALDFFYTVKESLFESIHNTLLLLMGDIFLQQTDVILYTATTFTYLILAFIGYYILKYPYKAIRYASRYIWLRFRLGKNADKDSREPISKINAESKIKINTKSEK